MVAGFRTYYKLDAQGGHNQAEAGQKFAKTIFQRLDYFLFTKKLKRSAANTEESADLSNYQEYSINFKVRVVA